MSRPACHDCVSSTHANPARCTAIAIEVSVGDATHATAYVADAIATSSTRSRTPPTYASAANRTSHPRITGAWRATRDSLGITERSVARDTGERRDRRTGLCDLCVPPCHVSFRDG